jgi:RimJ/RimL family protein N-acetyltransferase
MTGSAPSANGSAAAAAGRLLPLLTTRLRLEPLRLDDAAAMLAYRSNPEVARYQGWVPTSVEEVEAFLRKQLDAQLGRRETWTQLAIRPREDQTLLGDLGLHFTANRDEAELGVTIAPAHQRKGYAAEALRAALGLLFGPLAQHRVFGSVDPRNVASSRLLEALGMRREAHFRQSLWFRGEWVDDVIYALLSEEWTKPTR